MILCPKCGREVVERKTAGGQAWLADPTGWRHVCAGTKKAKKTGLSPEARQRLFWNAIFASDPKAYVEQLKKDGIDLKF